MNLDKIHDDLNILVFIAANASMSCFLPLEEKERHNSDHFSSEDCPLPPNELRIAFQRLKATKDQKGIDLLNELCAIGMLDFAYDKIAQYRNSEDQAKAQEKRHRDFHNRAYQTYLEYEGKIPLIEKLMEYSKQVQDELDPKNPDAELWVFMNSFNVNIIGKSRNIWVWSKIAPFYKGLDIDEVFENFILSNREASLWNSVRDFVSDIPKILDKTNSSTD